MFWPFAKFRALATTYPQSAAIMLNDMRFALLEAKPELLDKPPEEKKEEEVPLTFKEKLLLRKKEKAAM
jgi:hypothetical protein